QLPFGAVSSVSAGWAAASATAIGASSVVNLRWLPIGASVFSVELVIGVGTEHQPLFPVVCPLRGACLLELLRGADRRPGNFCLVCKAGLDQRFPGICLVNRIDPRHDRALVNSGEQGVGVDVWRNP